MNEKIKVTVGFRNGNQIEFCCDKISVNRNNLTGELVGYKIDGCDEKANPMYLNICEIIYIITGR